MSWFDLSAGRKYQLNREHVSATLMAATAIVLLKTQQLRSYIFIFILFPFTPRPLLASYLKRPPVMHGKYQSVEANETVVALHTPFMVLSCFRKADRETISQPRRRALAQLLLLLLLTLTLLLPLVRMASAIPRPFIRNESAIQSGTTA